MTYNPVPFARNPKFWRLCGYAVLIGLFAGTAAWGFTKIVAEGTNVLWPGDDLRAEYRVVASRTHRS